MKPMIGKIYKYFERNKTPEEKSLYREVCSFLDPYLVTEQKCTLALFSSLFFVYVCIFGIYSNYLFVFGALMGALIVWPFFGFKGSKYRLSRGKFQSLSGYCFHI